MSRALRIVAIVAGALVALVAAGVAIVATRFDAPAIVARAAAEASHATGRTIAVAGPVELHWWPRLALVAQGVTIANPPGASRPEFARVAAVRGSVVTWALIARREVIVDRVSVEGLDLALETMPDGRGNWVFEAPGRAAGTPAAGAGGGGVGRVALAGPVEVKDAKIAYRAAPGAAPRLVAIPAIELRPGADGQFAWKAAVEHEGTRWNVAATTGDPIAAARGGAALPLDLKVEGGGVALAVKGRAERRDSGPGLAVDATIAWKAGAPALARHAAALAASDGRIAGRVDADTRRVEVDGLSGSWGGTKVDGTFSYMHAGAKPRLAGRLHADRIDLGRPSPASAPASVPASAGDAQAGLPLERLAEVDADIDFVIDRLVLPGGGEATNARGRVVVAGGKLAADPLDADLGGGSLRIRVNADAGTARARIVADAKGVELARVAIREIAGRPASGGRTTASLDLAGPARSVAAFRAGASGTIRVDMGPMRVEGVALDAGGEVFSRLADAINPFRRVDKVTEIQCFVARLAVRDGIAAAERTIAIESGRISASASGTIDLGRETFDLLVRPRARGGGLSPIPTVELAEVVRLTGPWRSPSVSIDKVAAARTAITVGGAAIASGGWSLLATPLLNAGGDPNPCATARAGGQAAAEARPADTAKAPATAQDPIGALRKLFRR